MTVMYVPFPDPPGRGPACGACDGRGVTGEQYTIVVNEPGQAQLLVDVLCPGCGGCGQAEHADCGPDAHAVAVAGELDPDHLDDDGLSVELVLDEDDVEELEGVAEQLLGHGNGRAACPSCQGRRWWAMHSFVGQDAEEVMLTLRVPCSCAQDDAVEIDTDA
jgi:hypothetical protein